MFDRENVYVGARCWDSAMTGLANELRRHASQIRENDHLAVSFDTFYDRRNGFAFSANPVGGRGDFTTTDEGNPNTDWNPVWDARTGRFDGGWTVDMVIPATRTARRSIGWSWVITSIQRWASSIDGGSSGPLAHCGTVRVRDP
jgi:hypothetical protein